jgi:cytochrome c553
MQMLRTCLNPKVIVAAVVAGVGTYLFAPGLALAALPLLALAVCPISMLLMMRMMGGMGGHAGHEANATAGPADSVSSEPAAIPASSVCPSCHPDHGRTPPAR